MIIFSKRPDGWRDEMPVVETEYECPECQIKLKNPVPSKLLSCDNGHGPYFLV